MKRNIGLSLPTALMMFPQVVETIYSPALPQIAHGFSVTADQAAQTLSLYFLAFAVGVLVWGRLCDRIGRRPAMLLGLFVYGAASLVAMFSHGFKMLLAARMLAAFGAAVGSVGTQTILRDTCEGAQLTRVFSIMGIALAVSPAIGMVVGSALVGWFGYQGVFAGMSLLALLLLTWSAVKLPETRPQHVTPAPLVQTLVMMVRDGAIWRTACLVAIFNLGLFAYYQLAPFHFERLGLSTKTFGYSGLLLTFGVLLGSVLNQRLLRLGWSSERLVVVAAALTLTGGVLVMSMASSWLFIIPMVLIVFAYGIAIPNILAAALVAYGDRRGTAGALLGLFYYLMLGAGLVVAARSQQLGLVLISCGVIAVPLAIASRRQVDISRV